jgi:hypothetical protein
MIEPKIDPNNFPVFWRHEPGRDASIDVDDQVRLRIVRRTSSFVAAVVLSNRPPVFKVEVPLGGKPKTVEFCRN